MSQQKSLSIKIGIAFIGLILFLIWYQGGFRVSRVDPKEVWEHVERIAPRYQLDPGFVFSIAMAESQLNPNAKQKDARGIMQLKQQAWDSVTYKNFDEAWDWRTNITVGVWYLDHCVQILQKDRYFSYPNLAAAYHFGPTALRNVGYDLKKLPDPKNAIYRKLLNGERSPVALKHED